MDEAQESKNRQHTSGERESRRSKRQDRDLSEDRDRRYESERKNRHRDRYEGRKSRYEQFSDDQKGMIPVIPFYPVPVEII